MLKNGPFRVLISLLLAAWMPFCCCDVRALVDTTCAGCGHGTVGTDALHEEDATAEHHDEALASRHHEHHQPTAPHRQDRPCDDQKNCPCTCDNHKQTTVGIEKTAIELPTPVLAYILPQWEYTWSVNDSQVVVRGEDRASPKPPTSLLRQHCALIV